MSDLRLRSRQFVCGSRRIPYCIYPSARVRGRIGFKVSAGTGVVVVVPAGFQDDVYLDQFMRERAAWFVRAVDGLARTNGAVAKRWPYGTSLLYLGEMHRVVVRKTKGQQRVERVARKAIVVHMKHPELERARRLLRNWYKDEASRYINSRVVSLGAKVGVQWKRIKTHNLVKTWGRCTSKGLLSFNYRLIMAPPLVLDSTVLHELCHIRVNNHQKEFWSLLADYCPSYDESHQWLKMHARDLTV